MRIVDRDVPPRSAVRELGKPVGTQPPGELPDVRVSEVHVREKAVQGTAVSFVVCACIVTVSSSSPGMEGHMGPDGRYLPLLPRGDPRATRPKARFSVVDMPKEDLFKKRGVKNKKEEGHRNNIIF